MQITMTDVTENAEVKIAEHAAICYDADTSPDRNEKRVKSLMKQRHLAPCGSRPRRSWSKA